MVLMALAAISCAFKRAASEAPQASSEHGESSSPGLEIRGVDQESTFGCRRNVPIAAAEFEVLNHSQETRALKILGLERLVARCPGDQPDCTVGDLWRGAKPQGADTSPEPILWVRLTNHQDDGSSPHPVDEPVTVPPGAVLLAIGIEPWFPGHTPHWIRGKFRVGGSEIYSIEKALGRELFCP